MNRRRAIALIGTAGLGTLAGGCGVVSAVSAPSPPSPAYPPIDLRIGLVRIRSVRTGSVAVKKAHRQLVGPAATRLPSIAFDPRWTAWMPNTAWLVEHPERTLLVDTGETPRVAEPGYFACDGATQFVYETLLRFDVPMGVGDALARMGVDAHQIDAVVMTHFHSDHAGGLHDVAHADVLASRESAMLRAPGVVRCRWPEGFAPIGLAYADGSFGAFETSHALVPDGTVRAVPTPGHTRGHQSILISDGDRSVCLAGDASFDRLQVERGEVAGICEDIPAARRTLALLREQLSDGHTTYLASHDPNPVV
ncbi:MAG: N-acyl homoserine lactonase family protein [Bacteroidota bacterium]